MTKIKSIKEGLVDFESGSYLVLINPERIPHLVFLKDGRYYSLTYKGVELAFSFAPYIERLVRTKKKIIFLELTITADEPFKVFNEYIEAGHQNTTCFYPIKQLVLSDSKAEMIYQLIPDLYENNLIKSASHLGLNDLLDEDDSFVLNEYSKQDIIDYIQALKNRYAER
jgi:hypothetical protein